MNNRQLSGKALKITTGAVVTAIFGMMLFLDRQTGGIAEGLLIFLLPIPMIAYSIKYGLKDSLPVLAAMALISIIVSMPTTIVFAAMEALVGMVFGSCLNRKMDPTKCMFILMIMTAAATLLDSIVLASFYGLSLTQQVSEMQEIMTQTAQAAGFTLPDQMLESNYLLRILIITTALAGLFRGYLIHVVSLLVLRRLRFPVGKPKPVTEYFPPKFTGYIAMLAVLLYSYSSVMKITDETAVAAMQTAGIFGYMYLICFGYIAILFYVRSRDLKLSWMGMIAGILMLCIFPQLEMMLGFLYIVTDYHKNALQSAQ